MGMGFGKGHQNPSSVKLHVQDSVGAGFRIPADFSVRSTAGFIPAIESQEVKKEEILIAAAGQKLSAIYKNPEAPETFGLGGRRRCATDGDSSASGRDIPLFLNAGFYCAGRQAFQLTIARRTVRGTCRRQEIGVKG